MIQRDIFRNSTLEMSAVPISGTDGSFDWSSALTNRILVVVAILAMLANIPNFIRISKEIFNCIALARANTSLEHSYNLSRIRDQIAWAGLIPLALLADRYGFIHPGFFDIPDPMWSSLLTMAVILSFLTFRHLVFLFFKPRRLSKEAASAVHNLFYTFTIILTITALISAGILNIFNASDDMVRTAVFWDAAIVWTLSLVREGQILGSYCSGFSTILYLCALEMLPVAGLVFCSVVL